MEKGLGLAFMFVMDGPSSLFASSVQKEMVPQTNGSTDPQQNNTSNKWCSRWIVTHAARRTSLVSALPNLRGINIYYPKYYS